MDTVDYIVIGAGSAGCAVAGRLSENTGLRVLLLEAGGSDKSLYIQMPAASYLKAIGNPRFDWRFTAEPDPTRNGRRDAMPRGKVLGGTSSINGMLYVRGQPEDFDGWEELGLLNWSFDSVLPYFKRAEDNENGADEYHGTGGPLTVSNLRVRHPISEAFLQAGIKSGLRLKEDLNRPPQEGIGYLQATQRRGRRCSAARAYVWPALRRRNFELLMKALVKRIICIGGRAVGVEFERDAEIHTVYASRAVILSAGTIASPQLLMLSGIGPGEHLREWGIPVIKDMAGVGANFHDHPGLTHCAWVNASTFNTQTNLRQALYFGARWLLHGTGPGSTPDAHVLGFRKSRADLPSCDTQYHFTPAGYDLTESGPILFDKPAVTAITNIHRPYSRGWIKLRSRDFHDQPSIQPNLLQDERDIETLVEGAKFMRGIFNTYPLSQFVTEEFKPGEGVRTHDEWVAYARETATGIYHPAGSCRMGMDGDAVVDERLRVRGVAGLYVADASIMPVIVGANLNANCIMIGERCADFVSRDNGH